jgi:hypothetical protein
MKLLLAFIVLATATALVHHAHRQTRTRFTSMSADAPKTDADAFKQGITSGLGILGSTASILFAKPLVSLARAGLTSEEAELQQNQRPDALDAQVVYNGIKPNYKAIRNDIIEQIDRKPAKGPTFVRLAWHSSGTYDKIQKNGGSGQGTIRFEEELAHGANAGLDIACTWLEPIYKKYNRDADLSYADLYTFAGVVAIKAMKGPDIPWRGGRMDSFDPKDVTPDGRLPAADKGNPTAT